MLETVKGSRKVALVIKIMFMQSPQVNIPSKKSSAITTTTKIMTGRHPIDLNIKIRKPQDYRE